MFQTMLLACALGAADPFSVDPFSAVNTVPDPVKPTQYELLYRRVKAGETLIVYAGMEKPDGLNGVKVDAIPGMPGGVYKCWRNEDGDPVFLAVPGVTAVRPFGRVWYTTPATNARYADGFGSQYPVTYPTAGTSIPAAYHGGIRGCST